MKQLFSYYFKNTTTFTICILMLLFTTTKTNAQVQDKKIDDIIKINAEKYDFGKIKQSCQPSDVVNTYFEVTNIADKPVVIKVQSSWAYLTPDTSGVTIAPNKNYKLKISFSPCRNIGIFDKGVYITIAGIESAKSIRFTGEFLK